MKKTAIILFNLGGPDSLEAVRPFLFNLFYDKAIITYPNPWRWLLAKLISSKRDLFAQEIYKKIDGKSPILELTRLQADALEAELGGNAKVFIAMRYWKPFSHHLQEELAAYQPDEIFLLPLYPQFSTTTTGSSLTDWKHHSKLDVPHKMICCYPDQAEFIAAHVTQIMPYYHQALSYSKPRLLFSAHGLPEKIVKSGDPYQWQVEKTVAAIVEQLAIDGLDWQISYQSRVGRLKWIDPSTDAEIIRAGNEKIPLVVIPIAFVSEHSETLVELDIEYKHLADKHGVPLYLRVPALGIMPEFIKALAGLCRQMAEMPAGIDSCAHKKICPDRFSRCIYKKPNN